MLEGCEMLKDLKTVLEDLYTLKAYLFHEGPGYVMVLIMISHIEWMARPRTTEDEESLTLFKKD